ncbi:IclR family transcriptional regulator [Salinicoccus halitifaciens]|uniref:DNA-binding IclR family transcriptional regulator n=1 Tax=Salinicoccus halitifaciens TaxID=1073415 RepID=A0ABV2EAW3_9STAP|nr:IclR family transcriptional regulator [Salinicoccus halitifaciens]MCD2137591.1 IclR family transcriptional regulator [Salinicoccus halitifaciens]
MSIKSVQRAMNILELIQKEGPGLSLGEISKSLDLPKSTAHGIIKTLQSQDFIKQHARTSEYHLGIKLFELGNTLADSMDIVNLGHQYLEYLVEEYNETAHLAILSDKEVVYVDKKEGEGALRMYSQLGKRAPLYCTGVGKAMLAHLPEKDIDKILSEMEMTAFTPNTITDSEQLKEHLEETKTQGYLYDDEEIEIGLKSVAAPVFNHKSEVFAAISCAGPSSRFGDERIKEIGLTLKSYAEQISKSFGYTK